MDKTAINGFKKIFKTEPKMSYFSPGRVNIIGEHIDYNGGKVLPMAISLGIYAAVSFNDNSICNCVSKGFNNEKIYSFDISNFEKTDDFTVYIKGVILKLKERLDLNFELGFNLFMYSTLPSSSGLSSSAALELLIAHIMNDYYHLGISEVELVKISQQAEREYALVNCGIMDQFAVGMGKKNKVILLNTETIEYNYYDFKLNNATFIIINTKKPRSLIVSKYNDRRAECEEVLKILQTRYNKKTLCAYTLEELDSLKDIINPTLYNRAKHCITENVRVIDCINAMEKGDLITVGKLLNASHESLKYDYEVTGIELDTIQESMVKQNKVLGCRMTGAGFGGCLVALIDSTDKEEIDNVMNYVKNDYFNVTGLTLEYYLASPCDGTKRLQ